MLQGGQRAEFISKALDAWNYDRKIQLVFSRPGTPTDNAHIESFNGSLREECINTNWFISLDDARECWKDGEMITMSTVRTAH